MPTTTIQRFATKSELDNVDSSNGIITIDGLARRMQIRSGSASVGSGTATGVKCTFTAFPNGVLVCIPYCGQQGFGAAACVSYGSLTNGSVNLFQTNAVGAAMTVNYIVIGY